MGLFGFLNKLIDHQPAKTYEKHREIMAVPVDVEGPGTFSFEVVGESRYQNRFWAQLPSHISQLAEVRCYVVADLEPESDNPKDKNAVVVRLGPSPVGHIPRADAPAYRKWLAKNGGIRRRCCRAQIVKRNGGYGIWLDLPIENK
ncbi:HIRAN domain-containing protein [Chitiniphilus eburneus]|uniref:HIRAN domain-containing protein n=1 Tax=Chitiniphilus eburneus TaxID=2571148 RepID=UPI0035D057ED